jgi:hypothetical protein
MIATLIGAGKPKAGVFRTGAPPLILTIVRRDDFFTVSRTEHTQRSDMTARELYEALKVGPVRKSFGFGERPVLVKVDVQHAYTRPDEFSTAYETDPR